jgi:hypothetical protein
MEQPHVTRPRFPKGYVENPQVLLPWKHVEQRLENARNYWGNSLKFFSAK